MATKVVSPTARKKGPLRRIVGEERARNSLGEVIPGIFVEILECGHKQRQVSDIYGPTNAYSRRCRQCRKEERFD